MKTNLSKLIVTLITGLLISVGCSPQTSQTPMAATETQVPTRTPTVTETPVVATLTPYLDMWTTFSNPKFAISLKYPADWQPIEGYSSTELGDTRYGANNGFFQIGAMDADSIDLAAASEAEHVLQPYGSHPVIDTLQIKGQDARLINPSDDQPDGLQHQAALIVRYPQPVKRAGYPCPFLCFICR